MSERQDQLVRVGVWVACLLACGLVWTAVAFVAAGTPPW
jgi:hypothetical protein